MENEIFYKYVIYAPKVDKIYVGISQNPANRLIAHNHPKNKGHTKKFQPWIMIHIEKFDSKKWHRLNKIVISTTN
ncbi:MAG: GIY-YIG nuclease family protein [Bacteroidales bacterium]